MYRMLIQSTQPISMYSSVQEPHLHLILFGKSSVTRMLLLHLGHLHFALFQTSFSPGPDDDGCSSLYIFITSLERTYPHLQRKISSENLTNVPGCLSRLVFVRSFHSPVRIHSAGTWSIYDPPSETYWSFPHFGQWYKTYIPISIPPYLGHQCSSSRYFGSILSYTLFDIMQYIFSTPSESQS